MTLRICFIGDSFVNGYGDPNCLGWAGRLCGAQMHGIEDRLTYYNLGIRRETSRGLRARFQEEIARRVPDPQEGRLVFSFGANDAVLENGQQRVPTQEARENCEEILRQAQRICPTIMVGPPPMADRLHDARLAAISDTFAEVCADLAVPYLNVRLPLLASGLFVQEAAAGDGAHPGAGGYEEVAWLVHHWPAWRAWFPSSIT